MCHTCTSQGRAKEANSSERPAVFGAPAEAAAPAYLAPATNNEEHEFGESVLEETDLHDPGWWGPSLDMA